MSVFEEKGPVERSRHLSEKIPTDGEKGIDLSGKDAPVSRLRPVESYGLSDTWLPRGYIPGWQDPPPVSGAGSATGKKSAPHCTASLFFGILPLQKIIAGAKQAGTWPRLSWCRLLCRRPFLCSLHLNGMREKILVVMNCFF